MKGYLLILWCLFTIWSASSQQEFVVQSNQSKQVSASALDAQRGVLITYGNSDKTLKFWDIQSGLLYRTIDLINGISQMEVDVKNGVLYTLGNNTITSYSTETFEKLRDYSTGRIYGIKYLQKGDQGWLTLFAQDENYMTSLFALDPESGEFISGNMPPSPVDGEIHNYYFSDDGKFLYFSPAYGSYYIYSYEKKEFMELKGDYIAMFNNGDVLRAIYDLSAKKAVFMRMEPVSRKILWKQTLEIEKELEGILAPSLFDITRTKDRKKLWVNVHGVPLTQLDATTGAVLGKFPQTEMASALIDDGNYIYAQLGFDKPFSKYKLFQETPELVYGHTVMDPYNVLGFQNGDAIELLFDSRLGKNVYSFFAHPKVTLFNSYKTNYRDDFSNGRFVADPTSDKVFSITSTADPIKIFNRGKPDSFRDFIDNYDDVQEYDYSPSTKLLATLSRGGLRVIDTERKAEVYYKPHRVETSAFNHCFSLSPFQNSVAFTSREVLGDRIMYSELHYFDFGSKTEKWKKKGKYFGVFHIKGGKELLASNASKNQMEILDVTSGNVLDSIPMEFNNFMLDTYLSPKEEYLLFTGLNTGAMVYHLPTRKKIHSFKLGNFGRLDGNFVTNTIIASAESGCVKFIDITTLKELLRLYVFEDKSWVAFTPEGLFDGSQEGWEKVAYIKDRKTIPLEGVFENFYTPRLMYQVLADKEFKSNRNLEAMAPPPTLTMELRQDTRNLVVEDDEEEAKEEITVESEKIKIILKANPKGDAIKELRLYQNGKLVGERVRNLVVEDDMGGDANSKEYSVQLVAGENEFSAVAVNSQGTESIPQKQKVILTSKDPLIKPQGIQAYLLVVGINEYQNPKYNLNYAVADAGGFQQQVQTGLAGITTKVHPHFISNHEATREKILEKIQDIAEVANPQDIFIFYYAGHGVMSQGASSEFYLVPTDVTQLYGKDGSLEQKGISASELKRFAAGIPAQKQLYILDACQSAGALDAMISRGAVEEKAIAQLARSTGTHWLTASGSTQFATEFDELGHGVFTYALLEALSGKADSGDQRVTVNELKAYIESRVPDISEKYKGSPQYPSSFGFGQDFPVSIAKD